MPHLPVRTALLALALLASAAPALAQTTTVTDSLDVSFTVKTIYAVNPVNGIVSCGNYIVGVHSDPLGQGFDSDYSYAVFLDGRRADQYRTSPDVSPEIDPGDIPGVRISATYAQNGAGRCTGEVIASLKAFAARLTAVATYSWLEGPIALFNWEQTEGLTVRFDGTESHVITQQGRGPVSSYAWSYGDPSNTAITEHTFQQPGDYDVTLTVTDGNGNEDSMTQTVTVTGHELTVKALPVEPGRLYAVGDTFLVETTVTNTGTESVLDVTVPPFTEAFSDEPVLVQDASSPRRAEMIRLTTREPETRGALGVGESIVTRDSFRVERYASYVLESETVPVEVRAWAELPAQVLASSGTNEAVLIKRPCAGGMCETWQVGPPKLVVVVEAFQGAVTTGLQPAATEEQVRFVDFVSDGEGGTRPLCYTSCADFLITVTEEDSGDPAPDIELEVSTMISSPDWSIEGTDGGFACERVSLGGAWKCAAFGTDLKVTTNAEGIARVWIAPRAVEKPEEGEPPTVYTVEAVEPAGESGKDAVAVAPTVLHEISKVHSPTATLAGFLTHSLSAGAGTLSAGEWCEGMAKWYLEQFNSLGPGSQTRSQSNVIGAGAGVATTWICSQVIGAVGKAGPVGKGIEAIDGVADPVKKVSDLLQFTWLMQEFDIDNGWDLVRINGPLPPPIVVWLQGDMIGVADQIAAVASQGTPLDARSHRLRIQEVSGLVAKSNGAGTTREDFEPSRVASSLYVDYEVGVGSQGGFKTLVSDGYNPIGSFDPFSDGYLINNDNAPVSVREIDTGDITGFLAEWTGDVGDVVLVGGETETPEMFQVTESASSTRSSASESTVTLTFSSPARSPHAAGVTVRRVGAEPLQAPASPLLVVHGEIEAPDSLAWVPVPRSFPTTYDLQIATDSTANALVLVLDETDLADVVFDVERSSFAQGTRYFWRVRAQNALGVGAWSTWDYFEPGTDVVTDAEVGAESAPTTLALGVPYPNPAGRGPVSVHVALPAPRPVRVSVVDALGREVLVVAEGVHPAGMHTFEIDASRLSSGAYVALLETGDRILTQRMTVVR